jgi:hypothetical protein
MFVVWNKEKEMYVGKKDRGWPWRREFTFDINKAQMYRSEAAIKNSIGLNSSSIPGNNKKVLPPWAKVVPIHIQPKEIEC